MKLFLSNLKALLFTGCILTLPLGIHSAHAALYITIIQGLSGTPEYQKKFTDQNQQLSFSASSISTTEHITNMAGTDATKEHILDHFSRLASAMNENDRAVIYLLGHGSFDGKQYKFNIPGPDLTSTDLKSMLDALPGQNHVLVNTSSASGAMLEPLFESLESPAYILVSATRNGNEKNAPEFPAFFVQALASDAADINKNNSISVQEAFDYADQAVTNFFESSGRLATEHPQIRGANTNQFNLARIKPLETLSDDPVITQLMQQRATIDEQIEELQLRRASYSNDDYIQRLQALILQSASLSEQIENANTPAGGPSAGE